MIWCKIYYLFWKFFRYRPTTPYSGRKYWCDFDTILVKLIATYTRILTMDLAEREVGLRQRPVMWMRESRQLQRWSWERGEVLKLLKTKAWWDAEAIKSEDLVVCCWRCRRGGLLKLLKVNARWSAEDGEDVVVVVKIKAWRYAEASKGEGLVACKWRWDRGATWYCRNRCAFSDEFKITK